MSLNDFVNYWLGKRTDYDHVYAYQCVDLILQYLADCYGIKSGVWGNAIDYWTNPTARLLQDFDKVQGPQQAGDIVMLYGLPGNPYGHIMVAVDGSRCIEQNGQTGDGSGTGGDAIRYRTTPTSRVAGILRPKKGTITNVSVTDLSIARILAHGILGRLDAHSGAGDADLTANHVGKETNSEVWGFFLSPEGTAWREQRLPRLLAADATASALGQQLQTANGTIGSLTDQVKQLSSRPTAEEVASLKQAALDADAKTAKALEDLGKLKQQQEADTAAGDSFLRKLGQFIKKYLG